MAGAECADCEMNQAGDGLSTLVLGKAVVDGGSGMHGLRDESGRGRPEYLGVRDSGC